MKQLLTLLITILLLPVTLSAQKEREIIPVNWKEIKEVAAKEPQRIKNLVLRLSADTPDTTLTPNERILAYYGQSYLTPDTEMEEGRKLDDLMNQGKYEECLAEAKELLKKNPVSLKALSNATFSVVGILKGTENPDENRRKEGQVYFKRMDAIFRTIASTGDGSEKRPFSVNAVSDEYLFMRYHLNLWQIGTQTLEGTCDVFDLNQKSEYYTSPKIYFDVTRVLEIESDLF